MRDHKRLEKLVKTRNELMLLGWNKTQITRQLKDKQLMKLRAGVFCRINDYRQLSWWDQYSLEIIALKAKLKNPVFAFQTAAVLWNLPLISRPQTCHLYVTANSRHGVQGATRHGLLTADTAVQNPLLGYLATDVLTTVIDCAKTMPFKEAVVIADSALNQRLISYETLETELKNISGRGKHRAQRVAQAMSILSESAGETLTRLLLEELGIPYEEQVEYLLGGR